MRPIIAQRAYLPPNGLIGSPSLETSRLGGRNEHFAHNRRYGIACWCDGRLVVASRRSRPSFAFVRTRERMESHMWQPESGRPGSYSRHAMADCKWDEGRRRTQARGYRCQDGASFSTPGNPRNSALTRTCFRIARHRRTPRRSTRMGSICAAQRRQEFTNFMLSAMARWKASRFSPSMGMARNRP